MKAKKIIIAFSIVLLLLSILLGLYLVSQNQDIRSRACEAGIEWGCQTPTKTPTPLPKTPTPTAPKVTPPPQCPVPPAVSDLKIVCPVCQ